MPEISRRTAFLLSLALAILLAAALPLLTGCGKSGSPASQQAEKQKYHCPMHPTYVSDRPGDCPICNMKLVPIKDQAAAKPTPAAPDPETAHIKEGQFYCPMHPNIVSNAPGLCPECNMKLVEKKATPAAAAQDAHPTEGGGATVPGRISISLSPEKRQLIGLALAKVERRDLSRNIRTAALVEHDETRYTRIAPRFAGWIQKLHVDFTGAPVEKGQPLFTVYSPELFSAENEYLIAWRAARAVREDAPQNQKDPAAALQEAARLRLSLFEIGDQEIRELEQRGKASAELLFRAPFSGHVIVKNAVEGKAFSAGETLFEISDLSHVWLRAYVFEFDMPLIAQGQAAVIHFPYLNNVSFNGKVTFIYPHIDPQTRRGEIRLELDNPHHLIRPDMWANVEIKVEAGERLAVPASAVINTGQRFVAFVEAADHHLEPREVRVGLMTEDYYEVLEGLRESEEVVSRALFLVDSESQLKAAIAGMTSSGGHQH
jgi:RND family efflux transporter MFP subunit